jgi:hypothetical protein
LGCFLAGMFSAAIAAGCCLAAIAGDCVTGCDDPAFAAVADAAAGFAAVADLGAVAGLVWAEAGS